MQKRYAAVIAAGAVLAVTAVAAATGGSQALASARDTGSGAAYTEDLNPPSNAFCRSAWGTECYRPAQLQKAYDTTPLYAAGTTGAGRTICIVDSFGSPTIARDVNAFSDALGLPRPKLTVVTPAGKVPRFTDSIDRAGWAGETSLDVEWAHALAPGANIVLAETPTSETEGITGFPAMATAMAWLVKHEPCDVISQSYGATEPTFASKAQVLKLRNQMFKPAANRGITILASSGDDGATDYTLSEGSLYTHKVDSWPSSDPLVTSVGGTRVQLNAAGQRLKADSAWGGVSGDDAGGGGLSSFFTRPSWQNGVKNAVGNHRGTPDISMLADPLTSVLTYESFDGGSPWRVEAGTSAATPMFAGIVALADQAAGRKLGWLNPLLYGALTKNNASAKNGIIDVTRGNNNVVDHGNSDGGSTSLAGYSARHGYDLATGLGTIDAARFVPALVKAARK